MACIPFAATQIPSFSHLQTESSSKPIEIAQTRLARDSKRSSFYKSYFHRVSALCKEGLIRDALDVVTEMERENLRIGPEIYGELLQGCVYERALFTGQQIHARIVKNGDFYARNEYIETKLVIFYAKCDVLDDADVLFSKSRVRNVFAWAAMIGLKCRLGFCEESLLGFCKMQEDGFLPDNFVVPNALKACGALGWVGFGRTVHGFALKAGFGECVFVGSSLIDMYGKCGLLHDAEKLFDEMPDKNVIAWNSMIVSYVQNGKNGQAIRAFNHLRCEGVELTRVTISSILSASANLEAGSEGKQCHALAVVTGLELDNILGSSLINFYLKAGFIEDAELAFSRMVQKDVVTWNLLVSGYAHQGLVEEAIHACRQMRSENMRFDCVTLASLMAAAADTSNIKLGKEGHCYCIRNNLESDVVVASCTVDAYAKCGKVDYARRVFVSVSQKDLVLWNAMLNGYAELGISGKTLKLFYRMQLEGVKPNVVSWNSVISGFLRNGQINEAKDMFSQMQYLGVNPDVVTWSTLINGLVHNGCSHEAIRFLKKMQEDGISPNAVSIVGALSACTHLASLRCGRSVHGYIVRHGFISSFQLVNSLIEMYAKCGSIDQAKLVFESFASEELEHYNSMISAFALNGKAEEALKLSRVLLEETSLEPDSITFTNILSAFNHAGMVHEAVSLFSDMASKHRVRPSIEHYGSVVNLLARRGNFDAAVRFIRNMPFEPDEHIIGSLLASSREHGQVEHVDSLSKHLLEAEPQNSGNYVAVLKSYAAAERWQEASKVRNMMKERGLKKVPGCSWIQIGEEVHLFVAGDKSHAKCREICAILATLRQEMCLVPEDFVVD